jgi:hypothetical protein
MDAFLIPFASLSWALLWIHNDLVRIRVLPAFQVIPDPDPNLTLKLGQLSDCANCSRLFKHYDFLSKYVRNQRPL